MVTNFDFILSELAKERPVFNSEADFQFAFSWKLKELSPKIELRLERKEIIKNKEYYFDIVLYNYSMPFIIELKYKTRKTSIIFKNEIFNLTSHSAYGNGRYDFLKDIARIERSTNKGIAIFLTNDYLYWQPSDYGPTMDEKLRIHQGIELHGIYDWVRTNYNTDELLIKSVGKERMDQIEIKGHYKLNWKVYREFKTDLFKYLLVEIY